MLDEENSTWFTKVLYVQLEISTTVNVTTGSMPFMLVRRFETILLIYLALGTSGNIPSHYFAHKITELVKQAREMMSQAQHA